jgi:oxygen-independent coproporphyrinogen-3 oxidase
VPNPVFERLAPLLEDDLVEVDGLQVKITTNGRAFLRNACMALDERLWEKQPQTSLFSQAV